jgi:hypothetical protein
VGKAVAQCVGKGAETCQRYAQRQAHRTSIPMGDGYAAQVLVAPPKLRALSAISVVNGVP